MSYKARITDEILSKNLRTFGGVLIKGPKGCGKTTTAKEHSKSFIELHDEDKRESYLLIASTMPSKLLIGEKPRLIDEWQDAPKLWGAIRKSIDDERKVGLYILTGSTSKNVLTAHTGTMRISSMKMYPMSLYESGESNGEVSLGDLFNKLKFHGCVSNLSLDDLIFAICRGGWPFHFNVESNEDKLNIAYDVFNQIIERDMSSIDGVKRNPKLTQSILKSYARNICTLASYVTIFKDVIPTIAVTEKTMNTYIEKLEELFIIEDIDAWNPQIRSKTSTRSSKKRNFIDPSIAVAALGVSPKYFDTDFKTLGFLFECLCIRDLKIYSAKYGGTISYYRDRFGLEADAVLHLRDGRYALIEFKLGSSQIEKAATSLNTIENLIKKRNNENNDKIRMPDLKIIITAEEYGYKREDNVYVIPIGCLRD